MDRILFRNKDGSVGILIPIDQVLDVLGIRAIAEKDVPANLPYWFISATDIPIDRADREIWIWETTTDPDGFGGDSSEFNNDQLLELYKRGVIK